jgi:hypothetical protein
MDNSEEFKDVEGKIINVLIKKVQDLGLRGMIVKNKT